MLALAAMLRLPRGPRLLMVRLAAPCLLSVVQALVLLVALVGRFVCLVVTAQQLLAVTCWWRAARAAARAVAQ